jgi:putative oxidoreductase
MTNSLLTSIACSAREHTDGWGLLALRLYVAQEFVQAGWMKLSSGFTAPEWFAGLDFPPVLAWLGPDLNWAAAGVGEVALGLALALGLAGRWAATALLFITWVAVYTVHFDLGWSGWNQIESEAGQGFKVPLMLAVMLATVVLQGPGRLSVDTLLARMVAPRCPSCAAAIQTHP